MSTHNLCFEQKYEKYQIFYLKTFNFLVVKFSIYLNRLVFIMVSFLTLRLKHLLHFSYIRELKRCSNTVD